MTFLTVKTRRKSAPFQVGYLPALGPYPAHYRQAFASSGILYPLHRPPPLRSGYHMPVG